jgi:hypothetical protein
MGLLQAVQPYLGKANIQQYAEYLFLKIRIDAVIGKTSCPMTGTACYRYVILGICRSASK